MSTKTAASDWDDMSKVLKSAAFDGRGSALHLLSEYDDDDALRGLQGGYQTMAARGFRSAAGALNKMSREAGKGGAPTDGELDQLSESIHGSVRRASAANTMRRELEKRGIRASTPDLRESTIRLAYATPSLRAHLVPLIERALNEESLRHSLIRLAYNEESVREKVLPMVLAHDKQALLSDEWIRKQIVDEAHNDRDAYAARNDPRKLQRALFKIVQNVAKRRRDEVMDEWKANKKLIIEEFMEPYEEEERIQRQYY